MKLKYFNLGYSINIRYRVFNDPLKTNFIEKKQTIQLVEQGRYQSNIFDKSAAKIVSYTKSIKFMPIYAC
jgi:hypothetical protein